jgi:transcriptional regulator with XRE-family HTH domain
MKIEFGTSEDLRKIVGMLVEKSCLTQAEIGKRMGVTRQYVDFMLKSKKNFSIEDAVRILTAIKCDYKFEMKAELKGF